MIFNPSADCGTRLRQTKYELEVSIRKSQGTHTPELMMNIMTSIMSYAEYTRE